ncbi:MAG: hypothetical protein U5L96_06225 [Owenweeksia sp.]|nr:hypothetical protein [Owenweeksia sp.]
MKKLCSLLLFCTCTWVVGQSQKDFNQMGQLLFKQVTDTSSGDFVPMMRIQQYYEHIARQPVSADKQARMKYKIDARYNEVYLSWQNSIGRLQDFYSQEIARGAQLEYLTTRYFQKSNSKNIYQAETSFLYELDEMQNEVILKYKAIWLPELGFRIASSIEESF